MVLSGSRKGACQALRWQDGAARYVCGAMADPFAVVLSRLPRGLAWLARPISSVLPRLAHRWVAADVGCDSSLESLALAVAPLGDNPPSPSPPH